MLRRVTRVSCQLCAALVVACSEQGAYVHCSPSENGKTYLLVDSSPANGCTALTLMVAIGMRRCTIKLRSCRADTRSHVELTAPH